MKILITTNSFKKPENHEGQALIEAFADEIVYKEVARPLLPEELIELLDGVDGCIAGVDHFTREVIEAAPDSLKVISRFGVGVDRVDLEAAKERGIVVTNTPEANATAVAEYAFGTMIALARHMVLLCNDVHAGGWNNKDGIELMGQTLGIIGLGAIGKRLASRAKGFEMRVIAYDPYADEAYASAHDIDLVSLDTLLERSNFISIHTPLTEETHHLIDRAAIAKMPQDAILINTARGGIVDEEAVAEAIKSGKLYGAAFDAFAEEPPKVSPLFGLGNVILSPHTGAHTTAANANMGWMAARNCVAILSGQPSKYVVNP